MTNTYHSAPINATRCLTCLLVCQTILKVYFTTSWRYKLLETQKKNNAHVLPQINAVMTWP